MMKVGSVRVAINVQENADHLTVLFDVAVTYDSTDAVECGGGSGKPPATSSSPSLYADAIELIDGCIDAIRSLAWTSSSVASPSSAASNDANARSLLDTDEPELVEVWVRNAGRGRERFSVCVVVVMVGTAGGEGGEV